MFQDSIAESPHLPPLRHSGWDWLILSESVTYYPANKVLCAMQPREEEIVINNEHRLRIMEYDIIYRVDEMPRCG